MNISPLFNTSIILSCRDTDHLFIGVLRHDLAKLCLFGVMKHTNTAVDDTISYNRDLGEEARMAEEFETIDYEEMTSDLQSDIESGYIKEESILYILRQKTPIRVGDSRRLHRPVVDYFYGEPELEEDLRGASVLEAKKIIFEALDKMVGASGAKADAMRSALGILSNELKMYTKGNPKRNDRPVSLVIEAESGYPLMLYFDDTDADERLEKICASDLIKELEEYS